MHAQIGFLFTNTILNDMAISSPRDQNNVPAVMVTRNDDGVTPMTVYVKPTTHKLMVSNGTSGASFPSTAANRDVNDVPVLWGVSSADGKTLIPIYGDPATNSILVKST